MTDTWLDSRKRTCWYTDHTCECGGQIATNGLDLWCTVCRQKKAIKMLCEVWTRVVGYLRPVQSFHEAKRLEFEERQTYDWRKAKEAIGG